VRFVVDEVAMGRYFYGYHRFPLRVPPFSPVSDVRLILCTHPDPRDALTRWINGRSLGIFQQAVLFRKSEIIP